MEFQFRPTESGLAAFVEADFGISLEFGFQFRPTESGLAAFFLSSIPTNFLPVSIPSHGIWSCSRISGSLPPFGRRFQFRPTESGLAARGIEPGHNVIEAVSIPSHGIWSCSHQLANADVYNF